MKTKIVFHLTLIVALATFATGCCTQSLLNNSQQKTHDIFFPIAVYQSTNDNSFALEGNVHKKQPPHPGELLMDEGPSIHSYLIITEKNWPPKNFQTNDGLWIKEIANSSTHLVTNSISEDILPSNYKKITDLPKNHAALEIKEYHPNAAVIVFIPFTVVVDIATAPFQLIGMLIFAASIRC